MYLCDIAQTDADVESISRGDIFHLTYFIQIFIKDLWCQFYPNHPQILPISGLVQVCEPADLPVPPWRVRLSLPAIKTSFDVYQADRAGSPVSTSASVISLLSLKQHHAPNALLLEGTSVNDFATLPLSVWNCSSRMRAIFLSDFLWLLGRISLSRHLFGKRWPRV